jgi:VWFA-related protein
MIFSSTSPHNLRKIILACAALLCLSATAFAQQQEPDETIRVESNLVQLNVGVADHKGHAITDLTQNDFTVYEDGVKQSIAHFEPVSSPFSLVLLLDVSGSTLDFRQSLKQSALRFIDALGPDDRVEVVAFNDRVETLQRFTADRKKIAFAITRAEGRGTTHLYRALDFSLKELEKEGKDKRRKAIVVLTDGLDTEMSDLDRRSASQAKTDDEAVALVKPEAADALRAVLDASDRQGVTIYPLALPSGDAPKSPLTPQQAAIYSAARTRMQALADRTGGRLHEIHHLEEIGRFYAEVAADMRALYSIAYQSSNARAHDGKWRTINIEVSRADTIARSRPGYYAR